MTVDLTAEQYIAGSILIDEKAIQAVNGIVAADDFQSIHCRAIFEAALSIAAGNGLIDPVSIRAKAKQHGTELPMEYVRELMEMVPTAAYCVEYAHRVAEDARTRRIKELAMQIQEDGVSSSEELLAKLQRELEVIRGSSFQRGLLSPADTLRRFSDHAVEAGSGADNFVSSGYVRLDEVLGGGFIRGGLYVLGARPSVGKSTFAINLADNIKGNCLFVSLEMTPEQIVSKRVSRLTGLSSAKLLSGRVADPEWEKIGLAMCALSEQGVFLNSRYDLTAVQIQVLAQNVPELRAVIIDYLGLIQPGQKGGSAYENVTQTSREMKRMAISLNVPVICLCQLSRQVEGRENKQPRLSDLRDSGAIEQDADAVMFLFRQDYYTGPEDNGRPSLVQLNVAKNRHGRTGQTEFSFWLSSSTFKEVP